MASPQNTSFNKNGHWLKEWSLPRFESSHWRIFKEHKLTVIYTEKTKKMKKMLVEMAHFFKKTINKNITSLSHLYFVGL